MKRNLGKTATGELLQTLIWHWKLLAIMRVILAWPCKNSRLGLGCPEGFGLCSSRRQQELLEGVHNPRTLNLHLQERAGEDGNSQAGEQTENYWNICSWALCPYLDLDIEKCHLGIPELTCARVERLCQASRGVPIQVISGKQCHTEISGHASVPCFIRRKKKRVICGQTFLWSSFGLLSVFSLGIFSGKPRGCVLIYVNFIYRWIFPYIFPPNYWPVETPFHFEADIQESKWFPAKLFPWCVFLFHVLRWASFEFAAVGLVLDKFVCNILILYTNVDKYLDITGKYIEISSWYLWHPACMTARHHRLSSNKSEHFDKFHGIATSETKIGAATLSSCNFRASKSLWK